MRTHHARRIEIILCVFLLSSYVSAQFVNGRFSTSFYTFKKFDTVNVSKVLARGYQTLQLDVSEGNISLQTSIYGASNLSQNFGDEGLIRVSNLFLRWRNIGNVVDLNFGRVPVFAGVGVGVVDGAMLKAKGWDDRLVVVAYGGANVHGDLKSTGFKDLGKSFLAGAQIVSTFIEGARIGVSYVNRNIKRDSYTAVRPDSLFNPVQVLITPDYRAEHIIGMDLRYDRYKLVSGYGRYDYDLYSKKSLRTQLNARLSATDNLSFTADYIYREPRIYYNSFFGIFPSSAIREYEGGIEYIFNPTLRAYGKFGYVHYTDDASRRFTAGLSMEYVSLNYSGTTGYAGMLNSFYLQGMYPFLERRVIPTAGISFATYKLDESEQTTEKVYAGSLGCVLRPTQQFSFDMQLQWLQNPVLKSDLRLFGKINYWFSHNLNIFHAKEEKND